MRYFQIIRLVLPIVLLAGCSSPRPAAAQGSVNVQWLNDIGFAVHVEGPAGSTPDEAGDIAMNRGCEIARSRGYDYYTVNEFTSSAATQRVRGRRGVAYSGGPDGRPVQARPTRGASQVVEYGRALLNVTMISEGSFDIFRSREIVDARTCVIRSRPN